MLKRFWQQTYCPTRFILQERIGDLDQSALARIGSWQRGANFFLESPITGVGFNTLRYASSQSGYFGDPGELGGRAGAGVDSSIIFILATTGIIGFSLFLWTGFKILKDSFIAFRKKISELSSFCGLLIFSVMIGLVFESNFINSLFFPQIILWVFTLVGVFYANTEKGLEVAPFKDIKNITEIRN